MIAEAGLENRFSHATALLAALSAAGDWVSLREHAARQAESPDRAVAVQAKRMLALGLAQSTEDTDWATAADLYRSLAREGLAEPSDFCNLATVLLNVGSFEEAKVVLLDGMRKFETAASGGFHDIGLKIVEATGDREFRKQLEAAIAARGKRD